MSATTDQTWKFVHAELAHGDGPEVTGPLNSLIMAMVGRRGALADLSGEGVEVLASRP
jgi:hypothetical protein